MSEEIKKIPVNKKMQQYLKLQRESNPENLTYRQFYNSIYGEGNCAWMETSFYGGSWLDTIKGEIMRDSQGRICN